ncbi:NINE protein [Nodosilinea sp. E11]|uniref:NINE protein n=1 Tax=Nodosilinea sp. E11 TaxID=3037479 RepID=UPI0029341D51|nr:NINE protein [Nodosilinea sp. E11]WOD40842.1 NINE protein [Nodosilinea sp. E11]
MLAQRSRRTAVILAWVGVLTPLSGLHKFYLGQPFWGILYLLLGLTPIPKVACAIEGVMLLTQSADDFAQRWSDSVAQASSPLDPTRVSAQVSALGVALRELDTLRQEGLISELEFEQKRRHLLEQVT